MKKRRPITDSMKLKVLRRVNPSVPCEAHYSRHCRGTIQLLDADYDHWLALVNGGKHRADNLRLICDPCHALKSAHEHIANAKAKRLRNPKPSKNPMPKVSKPFVKRFDPWGKEPRVK